MSSLWDSFAEKIHKSTITVEEMTDLIVFLDEFDTLNDDLLKTVVTKPLSFAKYDFTNWADLQAYIHGNCINKNVLIYLITSLHDFDHANEQVLMYSYTKDKHYWKTHKTYKSWMGTFKDGKWNYSKQYKEIHAKQEGV